MGLKVYLLSRITLRSAYMGLGYMVFFDYISHFWMGQNRFLYNKINGIYGFSWVLMGYMVFHGFSAYVVYFWRTKLCGLYIRKGV